MRRRLVGVLCLLVFMPLWIPAIVMLLAQWLADFIEWSVNDRWLATFLNKIAARIEYRLLPDHGGWKKAEIDHWDDEGED